MLYRSTEQSRERAVADGTVRPRGRRRRRWALPWRRRSIAARSQRSPPPRLPTRTPTGHRRRPRRRRSQSRRGPGPWRQFRPRRQPGGRSGAAQEAPPGTRAAARPPPRTAGTTGRRPEGWPDTPRGPVKGVKRERLESVGFGAKSAIEPGVERLSSGDVATVATDQK